MFEDIGNKIKTITEVFLAMGIICCIILGIVIINSGSILYGLLIIIIGSFSCWIFSLLSYGFGQLLENSDKLVERNEKLIELIEKLKISTEEKINEKDFLKMIKELETYDLFILLQDEKDKYTDNQIFLMKKELEDRRKKKNMQ